MIMVPKRHSPLPLLVVGAAVAALGLAACPATVANPKTKPAPKKGPGPAFASMTWIYSTDQVPEASTPGLLALERKFYRRVKKEDGYHLEPIKDSTSIHVGDEVVVQLKLTTRSQFEYMHLKAPNFRA